MFLIIDLVLKIDVWGVWNGNGRKVVLGKGVLLWVCVVYVVFDIDFDYIVIR